MPQTACSGKCRSRVRLLHPSRRRAGISLPERLEPRALLAADGHMQIGMNLENVVDWSPAWTFTDAFKASRGWITHEIDTTTWQMAWDVGATNPVQVDANGDVTRLTSRTVNGHTIKQMAGTLMFRDLDGAYPAGVYHAEWDGTGIVTFGFDATTIATGRTAAGRSYADLQVTPGSNGIYLRIEETNPSDPVRGINVWMPPWEEQSFAGRSWHPVRITRHRWPVRPRRHCVLEGPQRLCSSERCCQYGPSRFRCFRLFRNLPGELCIGCLPLLLRIRRSSPAVRPADLHANRQLSWQVLRRRRSLQYDCRWLLCPD